MHGRRCRKRRYIHKGKTGSDHDFLQVDNVRQVSSVLNEGGDVALLAGQDMALVSIKITADIQAYGRGSVITIANTVKKK